jgi:hypothetical protein
VVFGSSCAKTGEALSNKAIETADSVTISAIKHLSAGLGVPLIRGRAIIPSW